MKKIIYLLICLFLIFFVSAEAGKVFVLDLDYNKGYITKGNLIVTEGYYSKETNIGNYVVEIISFEDDILFTTFLIFH